jgi:hypothetical protein
MHFTSLVLAAAAFVAVNARVELTDVVYSTITVGKAFNITYADAVGPVTLTLQNGDPANLKDFTPITSQPPLVLPLHLETS